MKPPFIEHERVAAYNCSKRYVGIIRCVDVRSGFPLLVIETDDDTMTFNPKQCRRLKKKVRRKPREVWVSIHTNTNHPVRVTDIYSGQQNISFIGEAWFRFREVIDGKA